MTTKTGRQKLNFLDRVDEIMDPIYYGHPGIYHPYPANLNYKVRAIEKLTVLLKEAAQQEGWGDMVGIVSRKLSSLMEDVRFRYLERSAGVKS